MENYHKSKILAILIGILPLIFEFSSNIWKGDNGFFIVSAAYGLILLLLALSVPLEDLDQWFLEKTLSLLSVFLALAVVLNNLDIFPLSEIGALYQLTIISYMGILYFLDRHFNAKNLVLLLLNLNILAQLSIKAGTLLILIISVLTFVFYLIRVVVTFSEQLRPFLLCVYLIVLLISLVWYVPELPDFVLKNLSWSIGSIILLIEIIGSIFYLKVKGHLRPTSHLIVGIIIFLIINEISMLVAESNVLNTSYLVLIFILSLSIVNIFGNISLGKKQVKISVLIPAYNSAKTIVEALESIKNQTYQNWEIILINDGSQDETEEILRRYLGNTKLPLKYTKQTHHNYFKAIRHGLKYASGEIIFVLDADKILFNQNVFYRAVSTILGEKCDGMFVGIRAMYQRLKDGKFHLVRPYYRNEVSLIKTALGLGKNIYTNYAFWRRETFETSVYENYLINGMPVWYNAENNLGLRVVNGNFVGLKYRVSKKVNLGDNSLKQNNSKTLFELSTNLRTLHHIVSRINVPAYSTQATLYNLINRLHIASLYPSIFKQGQTSLKEITPLVVKNIKDSELDNVYLKTIVDFRNNFDPQKTAKIVIPKGTKIYWGTEIDEFSNKLSKNMLDQFYYDLMKIISQGTTIYKIKKDDQKKLEQILDFFTIRDYVRIISN
ncbi:glycosyltransferase [Lactobacillus johnsonii]|uniref:glycosyltransferase family 2 protein n=1 Tax=Lactobacillus johnsonii TaxID=33959 RepID=UPI001072B7E9|nr:glycosyltransferase family 2 protein [Lactobacillus johnsonii]MBF0771437.1 glycosyltransferase family 2 protein [Lactobacillus johnsonii]MCF1583106.1 glycosyltransferase family 2 protein [Lactobacillus johnsonii]MCI9451803.1 glycosyltransferase family 2 protein [Lactobacillus johnsonii]MDG4988337.1 glycosyltransferase family 2 protein [Lactobacillus johnsonii]NDO44935.1 glycosyltransferase family 2 protein [Lactobacillus johnsonii]